MHARILTGLLMGAALALSGTAHAQSAAPVKLGVVADISGVCGPLTKSGLNGLKLAVDETNAAGGWLGRKIDTITRDSKTQPPEGAKVTQELLSVEKVDMITGPCSSAVLLSVSATAKEYGKLLWSTIGSTQRASIELGHPSFFQAQANALMEAYAAAEYAAKQPGWKKIVTIGLDYEWGHMTVEKFTERLKQRRPDVQVVKNLWPKLGETNFSSFVTAALAEKPDVVLSVTFGAATVNLVKQAKSYGFFEQTKLFTFLPVDTAIALSGDMPEGVHGFARAPFYALKGTGVKEFVEKYRKANNGEWPDDWAVLAYDAFGQVSAAVKAAKSIDTPKVMEALAANTYKGMRGDIKMRKIDGNDIAPTYVGVIGRVKDYPFPVLTNVTIIEGAQVMPSEDEVTKMRAAAAAKK
ncbi:MAG: ABC transporter substrate-binding protein [Rhodospirillales bacterium]|nr:ABC transporter substrate-binding protein [Rhodospirillales bacterium]